MDVLNYKRVAYSEDTLMERIRSIGKQISLDYAGKELVLVSVLKGTIYFFADLTRYIDIPVLLDFIAIGVYPNTTNDTGIVRITKDLDTDITDKHVLIIEDIIRTGLTTGYLVQNLASRMPASVKVCSLLVNPEQQLINVPIAYYGFKVSNSWLVGYGMDVKEKWRNLPYIVEVDRADQ
ncbi:MAG: hypoxanthine phosphoribosyltransferase [Christensenellales bacterium]